MSAAFTDALISTQRRWMSIRPNVPLDLNEHGFTQPMASPEQYFQDMDPDTIVPLHERLPEQQVPYYRVHDQLDSASAPLDAFAIMTMLSQAFGFVARFLRAAR